MKPLFAAALTFALASQALAGHPTAVLRHATPEVWEALFRDGTLDAGPVGPTRGTVLYVDDGRLPRVKAHLQGTIWKGKTFHGDGTFTNRWVAGIRAGTADIQMEPSWLDGQLCLAIHYPPNAPVFGNVRDELRQVAPGVWLGRCYDATTGCPKNWFLLEVK